MTAKNDVKYELNSFFAFVNKQELNGEVTDILKRYFEKSLFEEDIDVSAIINDVQKRLLTSDLSPSSNNGDEYCTKRLTSLLQSLLKESLEENELPQQCNRRMYETSVHAVKNIRRKMEDRHAIFTDLNTTFDLNDADIDQSLFVVFDGHGGEDAAHYAAAQLPANVALETNLLTQPGEALKEAFLKTDNNFQEKAKNTKLRGGSTAVVVLIQGVNLTVGWVGDSQVVLCKAGQPIQLMEPHSPSREDERCRIEQLGGCVLNMKGCLRVNGQLAVTRAIGDFAYKPFVTAEPDVEEFEMEGDEEFLILACDGLWDAVDPCEAVSLVRSCIANGNKKMAAHKLVETAKENKSEDNITVMVVYLNFRFSLTQSQCFTS